MMKLFISHSSKDISLVKFIIHLLDFYRIESQCSFSDSENGTDDDRNINSSLLNCDKLLVMVTANTRNSSLITRDISLFNKYKPQAEIIPLIFRKINLEKIYPILDKFQHVDFTEDLTSGFEKLFTKFGMKFLDPDERRGGDDRRRGVDRRKNGDRRSKNITRRLYKTFCYMYGEIGQKNEDSSIDITDPRQFEIFLESVKVGARKFMCLDESGNLYNTNDAVSFCLSQICSEAYHSATNSIKSVVVKELIFMLAKELTRRYVIRWKDRRRAVERRTGRDRREICETLNPVWSLN